MLRTSFRELFSMRACVDVLFINIKKNTEENKSFAKKTWNMAGDGRFYFYFLNFFII